MLTLTLTDVMELGWHALHKIFWQLVDTRASIFQRLSKCYLYGIREKYLKP